MNPTIRNPYATNKRPRAESPARARNNNDNHQPSSSATDAAFDFDDSFDWGEAVRVMDQQQTTASQNQRFQQRGAMVSTSNDSSIQVQSRAAVDSAVASQRGQEGVSTHQQVNQHRQGVSRALANNANDNSSASFQAQSSPMKRLMEPRKMPSPGAFFSTNSTIDPRVVPSPGMAHRQAVVLPQSSSVSSCNAPLQPRIKNTDGSLKTTPTAAAAFCVQPPSVASTKAITTVRPPIPKPSVVAPIRPQRQQTLATSIASIRPASWKQHQSSPSCLNRSSTMMNGAVKTTATVKDPRQASLPRELQFDAESVQPIQDEHRAALVRHATLSAPLNNGWTLFSHQKRAVLTGLLMRRMILALDMGLGKTLIGCCWARAFVKSFPGIKAIVLCPVSLKKEWKRTAEEATGLSVDDGSGKKSTGEEEVDMIIASWAKVPTDEGLQSNYIVVADEAHSMQSMQAARTVNALRLMKTARGVLLLTGTPMKNGKPCNLFPLLKAVRHPFGRHQRAYETHFCGGREINFGGGRSAWQANGAENLEQLRALTQTHLLHLTKEDCLKNLPPQTRVFQHVPVSSRCQMQHNQALQKLAKVYENRSRSAESKNDAVLGAVQNLRMVDSLAKVDATVQVAKQVLQEEPAIVIFTSFQQVAKSVHQKLNEAGWQGELLTGETPAKKRQDMVDNFQNGLSPVFVLTFGAGGCGLTLTAASTVVLLDRPWTPGDAHQAEARVRRIGQTKNVKSIWMSAFELDKQIDGMLESKANTAATVLSSKGRAEGSTTDDNAKTLPQEGKLSIFKLLQSVLPPKNS